MNIQSKDVQSNSTKQDKIKIAWFVFSCCEDNTVVFTELLNDHWKEWRDLFDFRHVNVMKSKNVFDEFDVAFVEGAIASENHKKRLLEIREKTKKLVAVGSCAVTGMPAGQRNFFNEEQKKNIEPLIEHFASFPKALKVSDIVKVDAQVPGCPMKPEDFVGAVNSLVAELKNK